MISPPRLSVLKMPFRVFSSSWGQNLDYYLEAATATMLDVGDTSFLGISRIFSDPVYRTETIRDG